MVLPPATAAASELHLAAGTLFEYNFYGQPGLRLTAGHERLLNNHPQVSLSYATSRASFWLGKYDLVIDDILLCLSWHFRPAKYIDPFAGVDVGFLRFDKENDAIFSLVKNKFARLNIRLGLRSYLFQGRLQPSLETGYVLLDTSATFPLFAGLAVCWEFL